MIGWLAIIIGILVLLGICWYHRKTIKSFFKNNKKKISAVAVAGGMIGVGTSTFIIPEGYRPNTATMITNSNGRYWSATAANIQVAIDDLNSTYGGWVKIPYGVYTLTGESIRIWDHSVQLIGAGVGKYPSQTYECTEIKAEFGGSGYYAIHVGEPNKANMFSSISNMIIQGRGADSDLDGGIWLENTHHCSIDNVYVNDFYMESPYPAVGINFSGDGVGGTYYNTINNVKVRRCTVGVCFGYNANGNAFETGVISNSRVLTTPYPIGIWMRGSDTNWVGTVDIEDHSDSGATAVYISSDDSVLDRVCGVHKFMGTRFEDNDRMVYIDTSAGGGFNKFIGCSFAGTGGEQSDWFTDGESALFPSIYTDCYVATASGMGRIQNDVDTLISNSNGKYWAATWANVGSAINDLNSTGGWVSLPADSSITHSGTIHVFNQLDVGIIIEGNGCNLVKGNSEPFFNFSGYDAWPTVLQNEPIAIRDINFDCNGYDGYALIIEQKRYVTLDKLYFINGENTTIGEPYLFMGTRSYFVTIIDCVFRDGYAGIHFNDNYELGFGSSNAGLVTNTAFKNLTQYAINNTDANSLAISYSAVEYCGNATTHNAGIICDEETYIDNMLWAEWNEEALVNFTGNDCVFRDSSHISVSSETSGAVGIKNYGDNTRIENVYFLPTGRTCIELMDGDNIVIRDCTVSDDEGVINVFIDADNSSYKNLTISGNTIENSYTKVVKLATVENLKMINNNFNNLCTGTATHGVSVEWDVVSSGSNSIITGNTFSGGALATYCLQINHGDRALISNNVFDSYTGTTDGIYLHYADNVTICNNIVTPSIDVFIVEGVSIDNLKVWGNDGYDNSTYEYIPTGSVTAHYSSPSDGAMMFCDSNSTLAVYWSDRWFYYDYDTTDG